MKKLSIVLCLLTATLAQAASWRGIEPGVATQDQIVHRFGTPTKVVHRPSADMLGYFDAQTIKGTQQVIFRLDKKSGVVTQIDVFPSVKVTRAMVENTFGPECDPKSPGGACFVEKLQHAKPYYHYLYPAEGLAVFFTKDGRIVFSFVYLPKPSAPPPSEPVAENPGNAATPPPESGNEGTETASSSSDEGDQLTAALDDDLLSGNSTQVGGSVRTLGMMMAGNPLSLPSGTGTVDDQNPAAFSAETLRLQLDIKRGSSFRFVVHDVLGLGLNSNDTSAGSLSLTEGHSAPLWAPMNWDLTSNGRLALQDRIDWLWVRFGIGSATLTLGRQPITLARSLLWTPEDLVAPFSPIQVDTEFKPGVDGLRLDVPVSSAATFTLIGVVGRTTGEKNFDVTADGSAAMSRLDFNLGSTRFGFMTGWVRRDIVGAGDWFFDLGHGTDFHGELTYTYVPVVARRPYDRSQFVRTSLGFTRSITPKLRVIAEGYYNGAGAKDPSQYLAEMDSVRFRAGEVYNVGQLYAGATAVWDVHPLVTLTATSLVNLKDPSSLVAMEVRYNVAANVILLGGAFVPIGKSVEVDATGNPIVHTEFGLYPFQYYLNAKIYF